MIVSNAVALAKADLDRHCNELQNWTRDFLELLSPEWHARDLVFIEAKGLNPAYIALSDWAEPSRILVIQTISPTASDDQLKMVYALTSVITAALFRLGHYDVGVALIGETSGRLFHHETIGAYCKITAGCPRIPEGKSQFNFSVIPGHISRSASPVVLN
jgi:hypothetical protein